MSVYESKTNKSACLTQILLSTFFIVVSAVCLIPILHVVSISFSSKSAILSGQISIFPVGFNTTAYGKVFGDVSFLSSFAYSIFLTLGYTMTAMAATILAAYPLSKGHLKGGKVIMTFIILTMYFDPGIIPNYLNVKSFHLLDTMWALIIPGLLSAYNLIILRNFFTSIDNSLFEAAYLDGCGEFATLIRIALPLTVPAIATLSLFYAVSRWNGVSDVIYYVNSSNLFTVQMKLKQMIDSIQISTVEGSAQTANLVVENVKSASIVISMLPMLIVYPFVQRYFTKGLMLGSVKG